MQSDEEVFSKGLEITTSYWFTQIKLKTLHYIAAVAISSQCWVHVYVCMTQDCSFRPPTRDISRYPGAVCILLERNKPCTRVCDVTHCIYLASREALPIPLFRSSICSNRTDVLICICAITSRVPWVNPSGHVLDQSAATALSPHFKQSSI